MFKIGFNSIKYYEKKNNSMNGNIKNENALAFAIKSNTKMMYSSLYEEIS